MYPLLAFLDALTQLMKDHQWVGWPLLAASIGTVVAAAIALPFVVVRIPSDYFSHSRPPRAHWKQMHPAVRIVAVSAKNVVGVLLLVTGLILLLLPGQGLLCMLLGLALIDLPGKRALERWIVARPAVFRTLNKLRRRYGHEPLQHPYGE